MSVTCLSFVTKQDSYVLNHADENVKSRNGNENAINDVKMKDKFSISKLRKKNIYKIILIIILAFTCAVGLFCYFYTSNWRTKYCYSALCDRSAENILSSMNESVNPCDDFYQFACGNWGRNRQFPKHLLNVDWTANQQDQLLRNISSFLRQNDSDDEPIPVHQARIFYKSCLRANEIENNSYAPIKQVLERVKLPSIPSFDRTSPNFSWVETAVLSKDIFNQDFFIAFTISSDPKNRTVPRLQISKPTGLPPLPVHQYYEKELELKSRNGVRNDRNISEPYKKTFVSYVTNVTRFVFDDGGIEWTEEIETAFNESVQTLLEFHVTLFELTTAFFRVGSLIPSYITIDDLQKMTNEISAHYNSGPVINWRQYFELSFANIENVTLDFDGKDAILIISDLEYIRAVLGLLADSSTSVIEFFMWWKVVSTIAPYTNTQLRKYHNEFIYGLIKVEKIPRELYCADVVNQVLGMATAYPAVKDKILTENLHQIAEMVDSIQLAFLENMKTIEWMDEKSKTAALRKIKTMKKYIGFPQWLNDKATLEEYYQNVTVDEKDFLNNILREVQRQHQALLGTYGQPIDVTQESWITNPMVVNAYNYMGGNTINIPAGYLQFPFYHQGIQALNYAAMGSTIGHEMTHSFDNTGKEYDDEGNANAWWTNETINEFQNRAQCFVNYYGNMKSPQGVPLMVNGMKTLDENIADNGGIRNAFLAYRSYIQKYGAEPALPKLEKYSGEQLFFIGYANTWCEHSAQHMVPINDGHSPNYARVWGTLANSKEFAQVWKCERGTMMNPCGPKCRIW